MELTNLNLPKTFSDLDQRLVSQELTQWSGAVNLLFVEDCILLIKRSDEMPSHKGQIGFFGGHKNSCETEPLVTAEREWSEESGLASYDIEYIGLHQPVRTSRNRMIIPAVGCYKKSLDQLFESIVSNGEWSNLVAVKINKIKEEHLWTSAQVLSGKDQFSFHFFPLIEDHTRYFHNDFAVPYTLWGASAKMILNFFKNPKLDDNFPLF